jgi:hypothetical protein
MTVGGSAAPIATDDPRPAKRSLSHSQGLPQMKFNDTAPILPAASGPPPWLLAKLAENATMEAAVLKRPVEGKANILALPKHAIPLYEFQHFTYRSDFGSDFFMESYRSQVRGVRSSVRSWCI